MKSQPKQGQEMKRIEKVKVTEKRVKYFSDEFKKEIIEEVLSGKYTKAEAQQIYGIGGNSSILTWMRKFNIAPKYNPPKNPQTAEIPMSLNVKNGYEDLTKDEKIRVLEKALEIEQNKTMLYEKMIEIAERDYGLAIKKKSEPKQSKKLNRKKVKK